MPEWTGTVIAKSPNGIKAVDKGAWLNFTKEEWRGTPFDEVEKGDRVRIEYSEDKGQTYISVIENLTRPTPANAASDAPSEENFPPDEGFPGDEAGTPLPSGLPSSATESSLAPEVSHGQDLWAKDKLRARTDCLACATGIYKSVIEAGIYKEFPSAETVAAYAATLEEWAKSE